MDNKIRCMSLAEEFGLELFNLVLVVHYLLLGALHVLLHHLLAWGGHAVLLVHLLQLAEELLFVELLDSLELF